MLRAAVVLAFASAALAAEAALPNGGFEKALQGWTVANNSGGFVAEVDRRSKKEGACSLHLAKSGGPPMDVLRADLRSIEAGQKIAIRAWFRAKGVKNGWFKVFFYDGKGETIDQGPDVKSLAGDYDWKEIGITNTAPKGTESAAIFVLLVQPGDLWVDDVRLEGAGPAKKERPRPLDRATKDWLDKNALAVKSLEFGEGFGDLEPLAAVWKDVRIVQLGETTHGDGETNRAKARLARFLHERCGFEVVAFESGLFDCDRANALLREGKWREAMHASVFPIWRIEETVPLFQHMAKVARSDRPLTLAGFDMQATGKAGEALVAEACALAGASDEDRAAWGELDRLLREDDYKPPDAARAKGLEALARVRGLVAERRAALVERVGEPEVALVERALEDFAVREEFRRAGNDIHLRDRRMAENLKWLAEVRYPGKKILTWAATTHLVKDHKPVAGGGEGNLFATWKAMGHFVDEWFGANAYTIGFLSSEGPSGVWGAKFEIPEPNRDSLEDLFARYGKPLLFVDLRRPNPFEKSLHASPMSYARTMRAEWPKVLDALFYIRENSATKFIGWD